MRAIVPRQYLCHFTGEPITIDGKAKEPAWQAAEWTEDFVDIEGSRRPKPRFRTRAKMLWDDKFFYVYAELEEPHVWGTITKKNEVMFRDNDFEVFISPTGENLNYHEFEMNALGTICPGSTTATRPSSGTTRPGAVPTRPIESAVSGLVACLRTPSAKSV